MGDTNAKYLYAVRVLRQEPADTENLPYVVVPEPESEDQPATGIGLDDPMIIGYRAYVNPATGLGPAYEDVVPDRAILFTGQ